MNLGPDIITTNRSRLFSERAAFSVASFVFGLVIFFMFIIPEYVQLQQLKLEEELKKNNLEEKNATLNQMRTFEKGIENVNESDIEKIKQFIPESDKVELHLADFDNLASVYALKLSDWMVQKEKSEAANNASQAEGEEKHPQIGWLKSYKYSFKAKGEYGNVVLFMHSLERSIPFLKITEVNIIAPKDKEDKVPGEGEETTVEVDEGVEAEIRMVSYIYNNVNDK